MSPSRFPTVFVLALALAVPVAASAQGVLTPPREWTPPSGVILRITPAAAGASLLRSGVRLSLSDEALVLADTASPATRQSIAVAGRTPEEIAAEIRARFPGTRVEVLDEAPSDVVRSGATVALTASPLVVVLKTDPPLITASVGGVFGLSSVGEDGTRSSLLTSSGLILDLAGGRWVKPKYYLEFKMSFASNDAQKVTEEAQGGQGAGTTGDQLTSLVETADRFSLGLATRVLLEQTSAVEISLDLQGEVSWTALDRVPLPMATIPDSLGVVREVPLTDLYPASRVAAVQDRLDRILPIHSVVLGGTVRYPSNETPVYFTAAVGHSERIERGVTFDVAQPSDPLTLADTTHLEGHWVWRLAMGMGLGDIGELHVDASGSLRGPEKGPDPFLRLHISKAFKIG